VTPVEPQALAQVLCYPNPAREYIVPEHVEQVNSVECYDAVGTLLLHQELNGAQTIQLAVKAWPEDPVYLRLNDGQSVKTLRIVVQH